jgi:hypothetical protein
LEETNKGESFDIDSLTTSMEKLSRRMHNGYFKQYEPKPDHGFSQTDLSHIDKRKGRNRPMLTQTEKLDIVY